jgi:hypothetical protein
MVRDMLINVPLTYRFRFTGMRVGAGSGTAGREISVEERL